MNNNENNLTDISAESIIRKAKTLPAEIQPDNDLWPNIALTISELPQEEANHKKSNSWMPLAMAASLLIAVGSISFAGYTHFSLAQQISTVANINEEQSVIDLIEQPYRVAKSSYVSSLVTQRQVMSQEVEDVLTENFKIIEDASEKIREALKNNPNDPFLADALLLIHQKEIDLLNQVTNQGQDPI